MLYGFITFAIVWLVSWGYEEPRFVIHGLWYPDNYCEKSGLNLTEIEPLIPWLNEYWGDYSLLEHEWDKHGVCSNMSQYDYFKTSMELYFQFNPTLLFLENNIIPSSTVKYDRNTIQSILSPLNATLVCSPSYSISQIQINMIPHGTSGSEIEENICGEQVLLMVSPKNNTISSTSRYILRNK